MIVPPLEHLRRLKLIKKYRGYKTKHKLHIEIIFEDGSVTALDLSDIYQFKLGSLKPRTSFTRRFLYQKGRRNKRGSDE